MAAGVVSITVKDGGGNSRTMQFWSTDGTTGGLLTPLQSLLGADGATLASSSNPLPVLSTVIPPGGVQAGGNGSQTAVSTSTAMISAPGAGKKLNLNYFLISNFSTTDVGVALNDTLTTNFLAPHLQAVPFVLPDGMFLTWTTNAGASFTLSGFTGSLSGPVVINGFGYSL